MWGSDNWGEMIWNGAGGPAVPMLDVTALIVLAAVLLAGSVFALRRARSPQ
jgi:hypothetical protein